MCEITHCVKKYTVRSPFRVNCERKKFPSVNFFTLALLLMLWTNESFYSAWKSSAFAPFVNIVVCLCHHEKWTFQLFCCTNMEMKTSEENLQKLFHASILRSDKILSGNWVLQHLSEISYISCTHSETFKRRGKVRIKVFMLFVSFSGFKDKT